MPSSARSSLVLVLPGFASAFKQSSVRLPALERLVAYSGKALVMSEQAQSQSLELWQHELLCALRLVDFVNYPSAPLTWLGANGAIEPGTWLHADPVMLAISSSGLGLQPTRPLNEKSLRLIESLVSAHLADAQITWRIVGQRAFIHTVACWEVQTMSTQAATQLEMHDSLPNGRDATALRQLMTELQMLIHEKLSSVTDCNSFWLWGAGTAQGSPVPALPNAWTNDHYTRGIYLSANQDAKCNRLPETLSTAIDRPKKCDALVVVRDQNFEQLDRNWFAPALQALDAGRFDSLSVCLDGWQVHANRSLLRRWFARPRSLLESIAKELGEMESKE